MARNYPNLQRRPFLTPIWLTMFGVLFAVVFLGVASWVWGTADTTTIVVIRQAEGDADLPLTAAGESRAMALSHLFGGARAGRIDAIYVSPSLRSRMTALPLATRLNLAPIVTADGDTRGLARRVLREHAGGRILVVAHRDTVTAFAEALSGTAPLPAIDEQDFGTMYVVSVPRIGHPNLLRLSY
jgi:2,3-bisphosphoglycerate-dependent phosphoglycerate mutase